VDARVEQELLRRSLAAATAAGDRSDPARRPSPPTADMAVSRPVGVSPPPAGAARAPVAASGSPGSPAGGAGSLGGAFARGTLGPRAEPRDGPAPSAVAGASAAAGAGPATEEVGSLRRGLARRDAVIQELKEALAAAAAGRPDVKADITRRLAEVRAGRSRQESPPAPM
jgi:hypothetical protein